MTQPLHLFEGYGVELEYMIVQRESLGVLPITDQVLHAVAGANESEVEQGRLSWSNELVLHVIELKTTGPADALEGLADLFQRDVRRINEILGPLGGRLMPTAMHPWMDPHTETRLWPHEYSAVYEAFNRIFDCRGHGWANLQCTHLNLPFANDDEFGRLHAAIRLVLPILPALAASSPIRDGRVSGLADTRLDFYRRNCRRIPSITGAVIPEPLFTSGDYQEQILHRIYADLAPNDPDGTLQFEWVNARGAIARFDRNTIEIRLLDIQECCHADLAILKLVVAVIRALVQQRWSDYAEQRSWTVEPLHRIFLDCIRAADRAVVADVDYLRIFGCGDSSRCTAGELWRHLAESVFSTDQLVAPDMAPLHVIFNEGCLAHRIVHALGASFERAGLAAAYGQLCDCLHEGRMFRGG